MDLQKLIDPLQNYSQSSEYELAVKVAVALAGMLISYLGIRAAWWTTLLGKRGVFFAASLLGVAIVGTYRWFRPLPELPPEPSPLASRILEALDHPGATATGMVVQAGNLTVDLANGAIGIDTGGTGAGLEPARSHLTPDEITEILNAANCVVGRANAAHADRLAKSLGRSLRSVNGSNTFDSGVGLSVEPPDGWTKAG